MMEQGSWRDYWGLRGERWTRLLHWAVERCPWWILPVVVEGYAFFFWLLCAPVRGVLCRNARGWHEMGRGRAVLRSWEVFHHFTWSLVEGIRVGAGEEVQWRIVGKEHMDALDEMEGGAILLTAHMGNYDVAAQLFAEKFSRPMQTVRVPEPNEPTQAFLEGKRRRLCGDRLKISYNTDENVLGVELSRALREGELVALQGDRVLPGVAAVEVPLPERLSAWASARAEEKELWRLPKGPFLLAVTSQVPVCPVFIVREGYAKYAIHFLSPLEIVAADGKTEVPRNRIERRDAHISGLAQKWSKVLDFVGQEVGEQWFYFESLLGETQTSRKLVRKEAT